MSHPVHSSSDPEADVLVHSDPEKVVGLLHQHPDDYITIGRTKVAKDDVMAAFGGTLNPGIAAPSVHKFANPSPLGLSGFALTTFVLSIANFNGQGLKEPNVVVGLAFFYGGLTQLLAGMWEMAIQNTFAATALCSYGAFWLSYAAILTPWFGILQAYEGVEDQLASGLGFFLLGWCIFTWGLTACTMKSTLMFFGMFFLLGVTFLLLAIGEFAGSGGCTKAGGIIGLVVAILAWYNAFAGVATPENSYVTARPIYLPGGGAPAMKFKSS